MNPSNTLELRAATGRATLPPASSAAQWLAGALRRATSLAGFLKLSAVSAAEARTELLRLADAYEASQPGYAADLRAAAQRSE